MNEDYNASLDSYRSRLHQKPNIPKVNDVLDDQDDAMWRLQQWRNARMIKNLEGGDPSIDKEEEQQQNKKPVLVKRDESIDEQNNSIEQSNEVLLKAQQTPREDALKLEAKESYGFKEAASISQNDMSRVHVRSAQGKRIKKDIDVQRYGKVSLALSKKSDSIQQNSIESNKKQIRIKVSEVGNYDDVGHDEDDGEQDKKDEPLIIKTADIGIDKMALRKSKTRISSKKDTQSSLGLPGNSIQRANSDTRNLEQTDEYTRAITGNKTKQMREHEKELWIQLQTHTRYSDETVRTYTSLKNVFKKRVQFSEATEKFKKRLENRYQIGHQEMAEYTYKTVSVTNSHQGSASKAQNNDDDSDAEVETESLWRNFIRAYEDSMAMVKDETHFYTHGKYHIFSQSSLSLMTNRSLVRWAFVWLVTWKRFENFIILLIGLNSLTLGIKDYTDKDNLSQRNIFVESLDPFFSYIFLIECACKIIAQGWLFGTNAYLTDAWNWLDFIVVITSLLNEIPSMRGVSGLRTFRLFRPLRSLTTMPSMRVLIGTLMESVAQLAGIMGLTIFFFLIFSILGVSLLNGTSHYRCYETMWPDNSTSAYTWNLVKNDTRLCGPYRKCPVGFCNSRYVAYDLGWLPQNTTTKELEDDTDIAELNYGITNFDDISYAFLTIFQCITMEGWTKIMNIFQDAYAAWFVVTYFILCIIICSVFLLNLTIAVMLMKYEELDKAQETGQSDIGKKKGEVAATKEPNHNEELRQIGLKIKLPLALIDFLVEQNSIQMQDGAQKMLKQEDGFFKQLMAPKKATVDLSHKYYRNKFVQWCYRRIMDPYFDTLILLAIVLNTITLALDQYPDLPQWSLDALQYTNYVFTSIFTIEVILKLIGLGVREFLREGFNQFDLLIVIISIAELFQEGPGVFSAFRAIRLFKIFKHFQAGDLRILIGSITFTLTTIGDYVILLLLFMYVFALLGMSFFAGAVKFDENDKFDLVNGTPPRANFDGILWAVITIFEVLMGESWNEIMYQGIRAQGFVVALYFIALFMIGSIIMLNLFLAILLGNFEKARNFGQKKQAFEAFQEIINNGHTLNDALDIILGDMSGHVKTKILKWDQKQVERIHKVGDSQMAHQMLEEGQKFQTMNDEETNKNNLTIKQVERPVDKLLEAAAAASPQKKATVSARQQRKNKMNSMMNAKQRKAETAGGRRGDKTNKYSYTVEVRHRENPRIKRLKEMNRQFKIRAFKGLKEVLMKKDDLDGPLDTVNSDDFKDFAALERERLAEKKSKLRISTNLSKLATNFGQNRSASSPPRGHTLSSNALTGLINQGEKDKVEKNPILQNLKLALTQPPEGSPAKNLKRSKSVKLSTMKKMNVQNLNKSSIGVTGGGGRNVAMFRGGNDSPPSPRGLHEDDDRLTCWQRFTSSMADRSLFIFHRDTRFRQWCLTLAEQPEVIERMKQLIKNGTIEDYDPAAHDDTAKLHEEPKMKGGKIENEQKEKKTTFDEESSPYKKFDNFILILIVLSSITLVIDNPLNDPDSNFMQVLKVIDIVFTILFFMEAAIKVIARGFLFNRLGPIEPYIRNTWNMLDFFVVTASTIDLAFLIAGADSSQFQALKAFRVLRALRPLRVISKDPGMKLVVNALLASIPSMTNVLLVCSLIILIFSIMGVSFFKGAYYYCSEDPLKDEPIDMDKIVTKADCLAAGGLWKNQDMNFDNCANAMSTLFQMMTTEGWLDVMEAGIDSQGIDKQPKYNSNLFMLAFFIIFMIIGSQFIINLFVGVVIDNFQTIKEKEELDNMFVTEQQRSWIEIQKVGQSKTLKVKIEAPEGLRAPFYELVNSAIFEHIITFFILTNTIFMALKSYRMSPVLEEVSEQANWVFAFVFNMEMVLKLIGLGKIYFLYPWNNFDMIIVIATDLGLLLRGLNLSATFSEAASIVRGFRIMRMFKLIRTSLTIRLILDTVFNILPQIKNVMTLIALLLFIFAALGTNLFSQVMLQENLNDKMNFKGFGNALIILMSFSTGEDWNAFMYELANKEGYDGVPCLEVQSYEDYRDSGFVTKQCGTSISLLFFFAFTIIVSILIMNLSVAAVIEGLDTAKKENMGVVQGDEIDELIDLWQEYDPTASGFITTKSLVFLLYELKPPLGRRSKSFDDENAMEEGEHSKGRKEDKYLVNYEKGIVMRKREALALLRDLKIRVNTDSKVHFVDVFRALIKRIFEEQDVDYKLSPNLNKKIKSQWTAKHTDSKSGFDPNYKFTASEQQAGQIIVRWARGILSKLKYQQRGMKTNPKNDKASKKGSAKQKQEEMKQNNEVLKEQARIIQNIIMQRPDDADDGGANADPTQGRRKARWFEQRWKKAGGGSLLAHLNDDLSQTADDDSDNTKDDAISKKKGSQEEAGTSDDETKSGIEINKSNSVSADADTVERASAMKLRERSARRLSQIKKNDDEEEDLLGPRAKVAVSNFREGQVDQGQLKEVLNNASKLKERVQIVLYDMENDRQDASQMQVFEPNKNGVLQRNQRLEKNEQILENRRRVIRSMADEVQFGEAKDQSKIDKLNMRKKQLAEKAAERKQEAKLEQARQSTFSRDWHAIDSGMTGKTIEMDERFVAPASMHKMAQIILTDPKQLKGDEVGDLSLGRAHGPGLLVPDKKPIADLLGQKEEHRLLPASSRGNKIAPAPAYSFMSAQRGAVEEDAAARLTRLAAQSRTQARSQSNMNKSMPAMGQMLQAARQQKDGEKTAGGSPRMEANPLPYSDQLNQGAQEGQNIKLHKVVANNFFADEADKKE